MRSKGVPQSAENIAVLKAEIQGLEATIQPLQEKLTHLRRTLAAVSAGRASAESRRSGAADRNQQIVADALEIMCLHYIPIYWQAELSQKHGVSCRQIRRILKAADINVQAARWSPWS